MVSLARNISTADELTSKLDSGVEKVYQVAKAAYGPGAGNVLLEVNYGSPQISRDGVNNVRKVYLADPIENMAARTIVLASEASNRKVGDGTTAAVILSYHLYREARKLIGSGYKRMEVSRLIQSSAADVVAQIRKMKKDIGENDLRHVATISAGEESIGNMIADSIEEVGAEGGIIVETFDGVGVYSEVISGFYYRKGFSHELLINNPQSRESRVEDADILITDKPLRTLNDIAPILEKVIKSAGVGSELVIIGDVEDEALAVIAETMSRGAIRVTLGNVPVQGPMRTLFLQDIATITGGKVITTSNFELDMLGGAKLVLMNGYSTSIIGGEGADEDKERLIGELREQVAGAEIQNDIDIIRDRLSRLTGKIVNIHVGGSTPVERDEVKLRVDDAVCAVQAAVRGGIVPGGGLALLHVDGHELDAAYKQPFVQLIENTGYNAEKAKGIAEDLKDVWQGFDLRTDNFNYKPVNLLEAGVIDPALVIEEVVLNAASVVSKLITTSAAITFADREMKND